MIVTLPTMGTVASLDLRADAVPPADIAAIQSTFDRFEQRFSLYRADSELSRVARGELELTRASEQLRSVYASAVDWRSATAGAFTPNRPDGIVDLDGIVKALAIAEAGDTLDRLGYGSWCVNVGGDILVRGESSDGPWVAGIVDPADRGALLATVGIVIPRRAIATSGTSERGEHIWRTSPPSAEELSQVTVVADDIVTADVLATAILAGGAAVRDEATARWDIDVLTADAAGALTATPRLRDRLG